MNFYHFKQKGKIAEEDAKILRENLNKPTGYIFQDLIDKYKTDFDKIITLTRRGNLVLSSNFASNAKAYSTIISYTTSVTDGIYDTAYSLYEKNSLSIALSKLEKINFIRFRVKPTGFKTFFIFVSRKEKNVSFSGCKFEKTTGICFTSNSEETGDGFSNCIENCLHNNRGFICE